MKQIGFNLNDIHKMTIGLDHIMNGLDLGLNGTSSNSFPPHNIIKLSENEFVVELAVAGFTRDKLSIEYVDDTLCISGDNHTSSQPETEYLHKGIASRSFIKKLKLVHGHKVSGANLKDGILSIFITRQVLEPNKISIDIA
jgi:molecular chaperone IbpA